MNGFKRLANKKNSSIINLIGSIVGIITAFFSLFFQFAENSCDNIFLKYIVGGLLVIAFIFSCYYISKNKNKIVNVFFYFLSLLFFVFLSYYFFKKKCVAEIAKSVVNNEVTNVGNSTYNDNSSHDNYTTNIARQETNIYTVPKQRTISNSDIALLKSKLIEKSDQILVQYLESNIRDTLLQKQIIDKLTQLGYLNVFSSPAKSLPSNLQPGRITIQKVDIDDTAVYKIIINPE